jgi:hypothetical protein
MDEIYIDSEWAQDITYSTEIKIKKKREEVVQYYNLRTEG